MTDSTLEQVFREEHGRVVATLVRYLGSIDLAEDAAQEAYLVALQVWPAAGLPPNPGAWLTTTARHKAIDRIRRESSRDSKHAQAAMLDDHLGETGPAPDPEPPSVVHDDRLRLMFTCCHPALDPSAQVALTLRLLGGLTVAEIASAFLVEEAAMAKRITRTKQKIAAAKIPYRVPVDAELPGRVRGVLAAIYLIFNEGYLPVGGEDVALRPDLTLEAIRLARVVVELMPDEPEAVGLLALLLLTDARRPARVVDGALVTLDRQDRTRWDRSLVAEGHDLVRACLRRGQPGRYQLLAAVGAVHTDAATSADTQWRQVVALYDQLYDVEPTPVVGLNRAVAVAEVDGPLAGLAELDGLPGAAALERYHPFHAARADLLRRAGRVAEAGAAYGRALELVTNPAERAFLEGRRAGLRG